MTEGTRNAKNKWSREHMGTISCRVDKATKERFEEFCKDHNITPNALLRLCIETMLKGEVDGA